MVTGSRLRRPAGLPASTWSACCAGGIAVPGRHCRAGGRGAGPGAGRAAGSRETAADPPRRGASPCPGRPACRRADGTDSPRGAARVRQRGAGRGATLAAACGSARRVLVVGTEELMYLPLRIAAGTRRGNPGRAVLFQSTTRSPVHADRPAGISDPAADRLRQLASIRDGVAAGRDVTCTTPAGPAAGETPDPEADLIVVVDDGQAAAGSDGVGAAIAAATGAPVLLAVLPPRPRQ